MMKRAAYDLFLTLTKLFVVSGMTPF